MAIPLAGAGAYTAAMRVLAIDVGSSGVKAGVWDGARFRSTLRVGFKTNFTGVQVEAPAAEVLAAVRRAAREAIRGNSPSSRGVDLISFCAFSSGVVVLDRKGRIRAGAITHQDRRSVCAAEDLVRQLGKKWLLEHTGNLPYPGGIGSSTLAWLKANRPAVLRGNVRVGQISSLIGLMLTGQWTIDPSQAVFLGLWDIQQRTWSEPLCNAVGISTNSLPRMNWAHEVLGKIGREISRELELAEGTPVIGGMVDTSAATIQTPMNPGQLVHASGSTDVLSMCLTTPHPAEGILSRPVGPGGKLERWSVVRTIAAAGSAIEWVRRTMFAELGESAWRRALQNALRRVGESDLPTCGANFSGQRAAITQEVGATFAGITLATSREDLLASVLRGLIKESAENYRMLVAVHRPEKTVYCMGGGSALAKVLHHGWKGKHTFRSLDGDALAGLVRLASLA